MSIKLISFNVNGIRAAMRKGIIDWIDQNDFDIICVQELKAHREQIDLAPFEKLGYHFSLSEAEKKGYSGVGVFSKLRHQSLTVLEGSESSPYYREGRYIELEFEKFHVVNCYFPSGSAGDHRQEIKMKFLEDYLPQFKRLKQLDKPVIVCGDFNICHKAIDIHDPVKNANSSGFKPEEREWMDQYFKLGYLDCFRQFHKEGDRYSWWSLRTRARSRNKGWRIDYITATENLKSNIQDCDLLDNIVFSDHCPVCLSINI